MARFRTPSADTLGGRVALEIRLEMVRQGISQEELAARLGWTQRRVSRRLTADHPIGTNEVEQVAAALGVPLAQLLGTGATPATDSPATAGAGGRGTGASVPAGDGRQGTGLLVPGHTRTSDSETSGSAS